MLPVHRVIAHREYGNTPPGGWSGRKSDPTYDMDWRRERVANFTPQGEHMPIAEEIAAAVWRYDIAGKGVQAQDRLYGMDAVQLPDARGNVIALRAVLDEMAKRQGLTVDEIEALVKKLLREQVVSVNVDVVQPARG